MKTDWHDTSYLLRGNNRQQDAYQALQFLAVLDILEEYSPVLAGTIPLGIDIPDSDLDIICEAQDLAAFEQLVVSAFGLEENFCVKNISIKGVSSVVANFKYAGFPMEIFGQPQPVTEQNAYRHMLIEARLLNIGGEKARQAIQQSKLSGLKTEPAFARYFQLEGNPYQQLLELAKSSDRELRAMIAPDKLRDNCIFCDIVNGKLEASKVYEDNHTLAFMNQRQASLGHVLVIPKSHYPTIYELDNEIAGHLFQTVVLVAQAMRHSLYPEGLTIWQSNGSVAGQEIFHVHIHLFPRAANDQFIRFYPEMPALQKRAALDCLAEKIRAGFSRKASPTTA